MTTSVPALFDGSADAVEWTCEYHGPRVGSPCGHPTRKGGPCSNNPVKQRHRAEDLLAKCDGHLPGSGPPKMAYGVNPSGRTAYAVLHSLLWDRLEPGGEGRRVCPLCGRAKYNDDFELDHIEPLAKGGPDTDDNIQMICGPCNRRKGALPHHVAFPDALPGFKGRHYG